MLVVPVLPIKRNKFCLFVSIRFDRFFSCWRAIQFYNTSCICSISFLTCNVAYRVLTVNMLILRIAFSMVASLFELDTRRYESVWNRLFLSFTNFHGQMCCQLFCWKPEWIVLKWCRTARDCVREPFFVNRHSFLLWLKGCGTDWIYRVAILNKIQ